jgi:hypothetical protein
VTPKTGASAPNTAAAPGADSGATAGAYAGIMSGLGGAYKANDIVNKVCKKATLIFARGTTEPGNMGLVVGPALVTALKKAGVDIAAQVSFPLDVAVVKFTKLICRVSTTPPISQALWRPLQTVERDPPQWPLMPPPP